MKTQLQIEDEFDDEVISEEIMFSSHISDKMLVIDSDVKTEKFSNSQIRSQLDTQSEILETSGL